MDASMSESKPATQVQNRVESTEVELFNDVTEKPPTNTDLTDTQMIHLHYRGCRCLTLWPRPQNRDAAPHLVGSISKDFLGVSQVAVDGSALVTPPLWITEHPHGSIDCNAICWECHGKLGLVVMTVL